MSAKHRTADSNSNIPSETEKIDERNQIENLNEFSQEQLSVETKTNPTEKSTANSKTVQL